MAQFRFTVLIMPNGPMKITGLPFDTALYKSECKVKDVEVKVGFQSPDELNLQEVLLQPIKTQNKKKKSSKVLTEAAGDKNWRVPVCIFIQSECGPQYNGAYIVCFLPAYCSPVWIWCWPAMTYKYTQYLWICSGLIRSVHLRATCIAHLAVFPWRGVSMIKYEITCLYAAKIYSSSNWLNLSLFSAPCGVDCLMMLHGRFSLDSATPLLWSSDELLLVSGRLDIQWFLQLQADFGCGPY